MLKEGEDWAVPLKAGVEGLAGCWWGGRLLILSASTMREQKGYAVVRGSSVRLCTDLQGKEKELSRESRSLSSDRLRWTDDDRLKLTRHPALSGLTVFPRYSWAFSQNLNSKP